VAPLRTPRTLSELISPSAFIDGVILRLALGGMGYDGNPGELARVTPQSIILEWLVGLPKIDGGRMILVHFAEYDNDDWD